MKVKKRESVASTVRETTALDCFNNLIGTYIPFLRSSLVTPISGNAKVIQRMDDIVPKVSYSPQYEVKTVSESYFDMKAAFEERLKKAYLEQAQDSEYLKEIALWDSIVGDGLPSAE